MFEERAEKYIKQHAGAAIENFLLKITDLGLVSCWIGAFSDLTVKNILRIPDEIDVEAILPVAYESKELKNKARQRIKPDLRARTFFKSVSFKFKILLSAVVYCPIPSSCFTRREGSHTNLLSGTQSQLSSFSLFCLIKS